MIFRAGLKKYQGERKKKKKSTFVRSFVGISNIFSYPVKVSSVPTFKLLETYREES